jgi:hypothetical protein
MTLTDRMTVPAAKFASAVERIGGAAVARGTGRDSLLTDLQQGKSCIVRRRESNRVRRQDGCMAEMMRDSSQPEGRQFGGV